MPLDLRSDDLQQRLREHFIREFPQFVVDGRAIDFDRLRSTLGEPGGTAKERYGITWPGKASCIQVIQTPSIGTLRPVPSESVRFESALDVFVEGDNLEVMKLLQKAYLASFKMIYIDPPYNTGSDFIYPDDYSESLATYLEYTGQVDANGRRFSANTEVNGRFHSKWLSMMYPRLYHARNLLRDDGVIFIGIDDHEIHNLRAICNEVFGEDNFVCTFIWEKRYSPPPDTKDVGYVHDNILMYRKTDAFKMGLLRFSEDQTARYRNPDGDSRGPWKPMDYTCRYTKSERPNLYYPVVNPHTGKRVWPKKTRVCAFSRDVHEQNEREERIWWGRSGKARVPALKNYLSDIRQGMMPMTLLKHEQVGNTDEATKELREVLPEIKYTPKPIRLIKHLMRIANLASTDMVLDFFAGSGTTAIATMELNCEEGSKRRVVAIQLEEPTGLKGLATIAEIAKARLRGAIAQLEKVQDKRREEPALGFRVFRLAESNFTTWDAGASADADSLGDQLKLHVNHIRPGRAQTDLLYEILLKSGFPLTTPIEKRDVGGKSVHAVAGGALLICLERELTLDLIRAMGSSGPERVVCLDEGFAGNDQLKANAVQIFRTNGVTSFKTV